MTAQRKPGRRSFAAAGLALLLSLGLGLHSVSPAMAAEALATSAEQVKAAYLHKFLNYAEWPPSAFPRPDTPYVIGVAGDSAIFEELARLAAGRTVNNRGVVVKRLLPGESLGGLHMLFIGHAEHARQSQWLRQAQGRPILTLTDDEDGLDQGSMINFKLADERVRFEVSVDAAELGGIRLSSRLLAIATNVLKGSRHP